MTPEQENCYKNSVRWRDFRVLFPSTEDALAAYATASATLEAHLPVTHVIEWRHIYHSRESGWRQLLSLSMLPMGHISTSHAEYRFITRHCLSRRQANALILNRIVGSLLYHVCFLGIIVAGVGLVFSLPMLMLDPFSVKAVSLVAACVALCICLFKISKRTRSWGLSGAPRIIAKDSFDLLSVRRIKDEN